MALLGLPTKIQICEKKIPISIYGLNLSNKGLFYSQNVLLLSDTVKDRDVAPDKAVETRVDMSKGLHFAYTSHGKSLTITLLTYTLTSFKHIFLFYQVCLAKTTKKGQFCRACSGITTKPPARRSEVPRMRPSGDISAELKSDSTQNAMYPRSRDG